MMLLSLLVHVTLSPDTKAVRMSYGLILTRCRVGLVCACGVVNDALLNVWLVLRKDWKLQEVWKYQCFHQWVRSHTAIRLGDNRKRMLQASKVLFFVYIELALHVVWRMTQDTVRAHTPMDTSTQTHRKKSPLLSIEGRAVGQDLLSCRL